MKKTFILLAAASIFASCNSKQKNQEKILTSNILLQPWTGPYEGVPAFDKMKVSDIKSAMETAIQLKLNDVETIADNAEPATFENTIEALEASGAELKRAYAYYGILSSNMSTPEFRKIEAELAPQFSDMNSKITQNKKLFQRIKTVYDNTASSNLNNQQKRVVNLTYKSFEMSGAELSEEKKKRYAEINKELSTLYTKFSNNVLHDEENYVTFINKNQLDGLPNDFIKSAAKIATEKNHDGEYAITNTRSSMDPFLTFSNERELRKQVWENYYARGDNRDEYDNNNIIAEILKLRRERVELLGYENFADWRLQNRMAKTPDNALSLMESVWEASTARVVEEVADMQALADANGDNITIEPWDYRYYAEKVRKQKYDLNSDEVKQYLQLDKIIEAMHYVAGELFNYNFTPVAEGIVPVYQSDVKVWEVNDKTTGENIGLWYLDPYARQGKRSGAWANTFRSHTNYNNEGETNVLATNNSNFVKPAPGEALLISWDDAITCFHEFGHALHFFSSNVNYPTLNGGVRDYTEFQSQLLERWLSTDSVINKFLLNYKTGEPMPQELVAKIKKASTFNQGYGTTEYLASALMDMKLHLANPDNIDVIAFEKNTLKELNMPKELPMRHRTPQFGHVFSGEGYATAYYGYLWAEVLTADAAEAFAEAPGGFYDDELTDKLVQYLFAPQNSVDPVDAYLQFRGRDAKVDALMRDRGFIEKKQN